MKIIDLSHTLDENIITYDDLEKIYIKKLSSINYDGYEVKRLSLTTHSSTHVDAPNHMIENCYSIDKIPLDKFMGKAIVLDCTKYVNTPIPLSVLDNINISNYDFIFFYTGASNRWNKKSFLTNYLAPSKDLIDVLALSNIKGIGIDGISIDSSTSESFYNHKILFTNNKLIYECLNNLDFFINKDFYFYGVPLKITNGDGSPIRAFGKII